MPTHLTCPDCKLALSAVESGSVTAHRCARCRGIWLDPASFQRLCEEESRPPDEDDALAPSSRSANGRPGPRQDPRIRYRACPACREIMNRSNFARVSGVLIDVCRAHGAWFDRGELGAIRRFLREGGLHRYDRSRRLESEVRRPATITAPPVKGGSLDDIYDVLVGGNGGWDVPSRIPRLLVATVFIALGGWFLWKAFHPRGHYGRSWGDGAVLIGLTCLYFGWRALEQWAARRR